MDSKFLKVTLLICLLFMTTIFFIVLYSNGLGPGQRTKVSQTEEIVTQEIVLKGQIGDDLYGWMEDDTFFDEAKDTNKEVEGAVRVNLVATSIEKDMRIQIVGSDGKPVEGHFFKIIVDETDEYKDLDRDGVIYIPDLKAGEYQVTLAEEPGFTVPVGIMPVKVKGRVEHVPIGDISLLMKTEEEVDRIAEDGDQILEETDGNETTKLITASQAKAGINVSRWNEEINWDKVKEAGVEYAIIRVGYRGSVTGTLVEDKNFRKNVEGALKAGIPVGLYFYSQAVTEVEAVEEASMALALGKEYDISYPIFIATENVGENGRANQLDKKTRTAVCQAFCETIQNGGYESGIYADKNRYENELDRNILTDDTYIWLAQYGDTVTYDGKYHIWQYTSSGRVLGIEGKVDFNLSFVEPENGKYSN